ncbi:MAG: isochorismatase family protein [Propionibacteriaceae bacterium]|nr:isochorismatase family protein [Propionibacteriaceae bacterium]
MTTLTGRPNSALVVIDVQNGVVADVHDRDQVLANVRTSVERARAAGVGVIWVQDVAEGRTHGSEAWQIVPELEVADVDARVEKLYGDAFEGTDLEQVLADGGVGRLYLAGAQTDACIRSTLHGAFTRGYDTVLVSDAHTTEDLTAWGAPAPDAVIAHTNLYWTYQEAPGREAGTVTTADVFG